MEDNKWNADPKAQLISVWLTFLITWKEKKDSDVILKFLSLTFSYHITCIINTCNQ